MEQLSLPGFGGNRIIRTADLWRHVVVTEAGCWEWSGTRNNAGYGIVSGGEVLVAHRLAYLLSRGVDPGPLLVCHRCDNPPCCNPDHLFLGTHADNHRDAQIKGRSSPYGHKVKSRRPFVVGIAEYIAALDHADDVSI